MLHMQESVFFGTVAVALVVHFKPKVSMFLSLLHKHSPLSPSFTMSVSPKISPVSLWCRQNLLLLKFTARLLWWVMGTGNSCASSEWLAGMMSSLLATQPTLPDHTYSIIACCSCGNACVRRDCSFRLGSVLLLALISRFYMKSAGSFGHFLYN